MSNMSYCKFQNTLPDLEDCLDTLENGKISSREEKKAAIKLIRKMVDFILDMNLIQENETLDEDRLQEIISECGKEEGD